MSDKGKFEFTGWNIAFALASILSCDGYNSNFLKGFFTGADWNNVFAHSKPLRNEDILTEDVILRKLKPKAVENE